MTVVNIAPAVSLAICALAVGTVRGQSSRSLPPRTTFTGNVAGYPPHSAGRVTASGETYDPRALTAAHATLPFGTLLEVSTASGTVVVRVTDRGPYDGSTILLVSDEAGRSLGLGEDPVSARVAVVPPGSDGHQPDTLTAVRPRIGPDSTGSEYSGPTEGFVWSVQLGSFTRERTANEMADRIEGARSERGSDGGRTVWRVYFGRFADRESASGWRDRLRGWGYDGFVKRIEAP